MLRAVWLTIHGAREMLILLRAVRSWWRRLCLWDRTSEGEFAKTWDGGFSLRADSKRIRRVGHGRIIFRVQLPMLCLITRLSPVPWLRASRGSNAELVGSLWVCFS